jgi:hypothetical protein
VGLFSDFTNYMKLAVTGLRMLFHGELSWNMFRRFFNLKAPVSI